MPSFRIFGHLLTIQWINIDRIQTVALARHARGTLFLWYAWFCDRKRHHTQSYDQVEVTPSVTEYWLVEKVSFDSMQPQGDIWADKARNCEFWVQRYLHNSGRPPSWRRNFSRLFDGLDHTHHIFSACISSRLIILTTLTTWTNLDHLDHMD